MLFALLKFFKMNLQS